MVFMPVPALVNSCMQEGGGKYWQDSPSTVVSEPSLPLLDQIIISCLMVSCGLFYFIGSLFLVRAFSEPEPPPLFRRCSRLCPNDEVLASWLYFFGTAVFVPITIIYQVYYPVDQSFAFPITVSTITSLVMLLFVWAVYPSNKREDFFAPLLHKYWPDNSRLKYHLQNDWLICVW
jgi:hypothetical protein